MSYKASTKQKKLDFLTVEGGCLTNSTRASRLGLKIRVKIIVHLQNKTKRRLA